MISVYNIKPKFQQVLKPVLVALHKAGVTANAITWSSILLSTLVGVFAWKHPYGSALIVLPFALLLRMALNALDGMMARSYNMQSKTGEVLNELGDVVSDLLIFFPLLKLFSLNLYIFLAFLFLSVINEYAGILGKAVSGERRYEGPMGKSDRALLTGIVSLLIYFFPVVTGYCNWIFVLASHLLLISTGTRISKTIKQRNS